jgi:hypothetical protein
LKFEWSAWQKPPTSRKTSRRIAAHAAVTPDTSRLTMSAPKGPYDARSSRLKGCL